MGFTPTGFFQTSGESPPITPADISGLSGWYDMDTTDGNFISAAGTNAGSSIFSFTDRSGTGNTLSQGSSGNRAAISSTTLNGLRLAHFDGNDFYQDTSFSGAIDGSGNHWVICVLRVEETGASNDSAWSWNEVFGTNRDYAISSRSSTSWLGEIDLGGTTASQGTVNWFSGTYFNQFQIWCVVFNKTGSRLFMRKNGSQVTSTVTYSTSLSLSSSSTDFILFANRNTNRKIGGKFAELMVFGRHPGTSGTDISVVDQMEGYLAHKWGLAGSLPISHPYKGAAPRGGS